MAKTKTAFFCQNCGAQYAKWVGQCTSCKQWNTIVEEVVQKEEKRNWKTDTSTTKRASKPLKISEITHEKELRIDALDQEFNRVLGRRIGPRISNLIGW